MSICSSAAQPPPHASRQRHPQPGESCGERRRRRRRTSCSVHAQDRPRRPPASGGSSTDQVPAADKLHQPSPGTGDNGMAYGPAESQTLGQELSPAYIGPEPPRAWGVAIWAEASCHRLQSQWSWTATSSTSYTPMPGRHHNYESTSPGSTPPRSLRVSGWVEPGAPSPTGGSDLWPIYDQATRATRAASASSRTAAGMACWGIRP